MLPKTEEIRNNLEYFRSNPNAIQRYVIELLEEASDNSYTISEPSNPFTFLLETSALMAATSMDESKSTVRALYPVLANMPEDIYRHMSDRDYLNQFSTPGKITMSLVFNLREILSLAVDVSNQSYKKITIPKDSVFSISDYNFGIHYPVDIRVTMSDGLFIVYDTSVASPMKTISDDKIEYKQFHYNSEDFININLPMEQFTLTSYIKPLNINVSFNQEFEFKDYYYYCRVYNKNNNEWVEIVTTHSKEIFDITIPTAQLTILESKILITIPQIYFTKKMIKNELRIDIYTTKGDVSVNLGNYNQENSSFRWRDLSSDKNSNPFSAPLGKMTNVMIYSTSLITGGNNGESFNDIRDRVVSSRSRREVPIKYSEMEVYLADRGYTLIKSIDNITDRLFLASKSLPNYANTDMIISGSVQNISISKGEFNTNKIKENGDIVTFFPNGFYKHVNGVYKKLTEVEERWLLALNSSELIDEFRLNYYYYNPFHYILDKTDGYMSFTPYMLINPILVSRWKIGEDTSGGYQLGSDAVTIEYMDDGYIITISTISNSVVKELPDDNIHCQLAFSPLNDETNVYMNGDLIGTSGGERVFSFKLETNFKIDRDDYFPLKNFSKTDKDDSEYKINIKTYFILTFAISGIEEGNISPSYLSYGDYLGKHLLPDNTEVISVDQIEIFFGETVDLLLSSSRLSVNGYEYEKYQTDIPAVYTSDIYKRDSNGVLILTDSENGNRVPVILHGKGETVLDEDGNIVYKHKKGDVKLINGKPIILQDRGDLYFLDILLLNAIYYFSTNKEQSNFFKDIPNLIVTFLKDELSGITDILLERTEIYYTPRKTMGKVQLQINENELMEINSSQSVIIEVYVSPSVNSDNKLKDNLTSTIKEKLLSWIDGAVLSISSLTSTILDEIEESVLGLSIKWEGDLNKYDTVTVIDPGDSIAIDQELVLSYEGDLEVTESVDITFIEQGL